MVSVPESPLTSDPVPSGPVCSGDAKVTLLALRLSVAVTPSLIFKRDDRSCVFPAIHWREDAAANVIVPLLPSAPLEKIKVPWLSVTPPEKVFAVFEIV